MPFKAVSNCYSNLTIIPYEIIKTEKVFKVKVEIERRSDGDSFFADEKRI